MPTSDDNILQPSSVDTSSNNQPSSPAAPKTSKPYAWTSRPRKRREVDQSETTQHHFTGRSSRRLNEYDRRILFRNKPGDKQCWRRHTLKKIVPIAHDSGGSFVMRQEFANNQLSQWLTCPIETCGEQATVKLCGPASQLYMKITCSSCKN